jgi:hypothetical protein
MKNIVKVALLATGIFATMQSQAQKPTVGQQIGHTATKVGHKTSEIAAKGAADVTDKKYEGKVARGGQTVYINKHSRYYYIDKRGHRIYVNKSSLRDKPSR